MLVSRSLIIASSVRSSPDPRNRRAVTFQVSERNGRQVGATILAGQWGRIERLGESVEPQSKSEPAAKPPVQRKAKRGGLSAQVAPVKGRSGKKAIAAKRAPKSQKAAKEPETSSPRSGTKTAQVVAMLQRKGGATLVEIAEKMGWQRHTVRGFMAGAMKKAGYAVESFKPDGGQRTYKI
jgi:Protein of unknown function (DUF3489)